MAKALAPMRRSPRKRRRARRDQRDPTPKVRANGLAQRPRVRAKSSSSLRRMRRPMAKALAPMRTGPRKRRRARRDLRDPTPKVRANGLAQRLKARARSSSLLRKRARRPTVWDLRKVRRSPRKRRRARRDPRDPTARANALAQKRLKARAKSSSLLRRARRPTVRDPRIARTSPRKRRRARRDLRDPTARVRNPAQRP